MDFTVRVFEQFEEERCVKGLCEDGLAVFERVGFEEGLVGVNGDVEVGVAQSANKEGFGIFRDGLHYF